jgi:hypothetical protein
MLFETAQSGIRFSSYMPIMPDSRGFAKTYIAADVLAC